MPLESFRVEDAAAAIGVRRQVMQMIQAVIVLLPGHAGFDVAGAGNRLTVRLVRHSQRKRGEIDRPNLRSMAPVLDPTDERGWETGRRPSRYRAQPRLYGKRR